MMVYHTIHISSTNSVTHFISELHNAYMFKPVRFQTSLSTQCHRAVSIEARLTISIQCILSDYDPRSNAYDSMSKACPLYCYVHIKLRILIECSSLFIEQTKRTKLI